MIQSEKKTKNTFSNLIIIVLLIAIMAGNLFYYFEIKIFGTVMPFYQILLIVVSVYYLIRRFKFKHAQKRFSGLSIFTMSMVVFWILYIIVQLFIIGGIERRDSNYVITTLIMALLSIYSIYEAIAAVSDVRVITHTIRILIFTMVLFAIFEITTGIHFPTSRFSDPAFYQSEDFLSWYGSSDVVFHTAAGIYYNQNDFFFFLALFSPFFFPAASAGKKEKAFCYIGLAGIFLVITMNDAFIDTIAILAGLLTYLIITKASYKKHIVVWPSAFIVMTYVSKWCLSGLFAFYNALLKKPFMQQNSIQVLDGSQAYGDFLYDQIENYTSSIGSLYKRITIYIDSLRAFLESKGRGLGPNGFTKYFLGHPSKSGLANPHNWWLEVLVQYGALVFIFYVTTLVITFIQIIRAFFKTKFWGFAVSAGMCVVFAIGCMAPSSMIGLPFQWFPLAFCVSLLGSGLAREVKNNV